MVRLCGLVTPSASWETFRRQIPAGLNFCASGLPYWTADIGAFFVKDGDSWYWDGEYDDTTNDPAYLGIVYTLVPVVLFSSNI